ncbi:MAG TPA: hypothetical protein VKE27_02825 [Candidatus Dormibacteraeota bacterium]|nr:hypothetical protein [Candidatus Dormibacteraeota bacterium]
MTTETPARPTRHQNLYAHHLWQQQRFFAGMLVVIGVGFTAYALYRGQLFTAGYAIWIAYVPVGLALGGAILIFRQRNHVRVLDEGVRISSVLSSITIPYDDIRSVKALPLRQHFQDRRSKMIAPIMKQHIDKPALFLRLRGDEAELAAIKKKLGIFRGRLMDEETIAIPIPDADAAVWEISAHLPERLGQNQGGARRRKRRR